MRIYPSDKESEEAVQWGKTWERVKSKKSLNLTLGIIQLMKINQPYISYKSLCIGNYYFLNDVNIKMNRANLI